MADSAELQRLVDAEDVAGVSALVSVDEVAETWCRYTERSEHDDFEGDPIDDRDWWASELIQGASEWSDRGRFRALLLKLCDHASSDFVIGCIGAGPLEDFVSNDEEDVRWVEQNAAMNLRFRNALRNVWPYDVSEETAERLDRAAGVRLARPEW